MDVELLVVDYLRDLGENVYVDLPENVARPVGRVVGIGGEAASSANPDWVARAALQVDVWAETKQAAQEMAADIRSLLLAAPRTADSDHGVFSFVRVEYPAYLPDTDWPVDGRPGPRYSMTVRVTAHPRN